MHFQKSLPYPGVKATLKKKGFSHGKTLGVAMADVSKTGDLQDFMLILTKENLLLLSFNTPPRVRTFTGSKKGIPSFDCRDFSVEAFPLSQVDSLAFEPMVGAGAVTAVIEDEARCLCYATTGMGHHLQAFCKVFTKAKEGKALTPEDYKQKEQKEFCEVCGTPYIDKERKICPKCTDHKSLFRRTLSYFMQYKWQMVTLMVLILAHSALYSLLPYISGKVYFDDVLAGQSEFSGVWSLAGGDFMYLLFLCIGTFLVLRLCIMGLDIAKSSLVAKVVPQVVCTMKDSIFSALKRLSLKFFTDRQTGPLMTRVLGDAGEVTGFFIDGLPYILGDLIEMAAVIAMMYMMNWQLATLAVVITPLVAIISNFMRPMLWHLHGKRHRASRTVNGVLNDSITGARVIKAFGKEDTANTRFEAASQGMAQVEVGIVKYDIRFHIVHGVATGLLNMAVWLFGAVLILVMGDTSISYGALATFVSYVGLLTGPLQRMSDLIRWGTSSMNAAQRMFEIMDAKPEITQNPNPANIQALSGKVEFQEVTFGYETGKPVLNDITFTLPAGQMLGIVGRSGVGKSTLVNLLCRLYNPDKGKVLLDGIPIENLPLDVLHRCVSTVSQESYVFMGSVADNIAYVRPDATRAQIIKAAMAADAHNFISQMPDGYDTVIGSGGRQLSGGERQRLSVARAILADSPILILDEATASVDTATERAIQTALNKLTQNRTTIVIAHRLSTLKGAHTLMVLEDGKVAEMGTHRELMDRQGTYYKLVELQTKALSLEAMAKAALEQDNIII